MHNIDRRRVDHAFSAVLFDIGGVLFIRDASLYREWEVRLDPPQGQLAEIIFNNSGAISDGRLETPKAVKEHVNSIFFDVSRFAKKRVSGSPIQRPTGRRYRG